MERKLFFLNLRSDQHLPKIFSRLLDGINYVFVSVYFATLVYGKWQFEQFAKIKNFICVELAFLCNYGKWVRRAETFSIIEPLVYNFGCR